VPRGRRLAMRKMILLKTGVALLLASSGFSVEAQQSTLTLQQATAIALEKNPARKLAAADVASAVASYQLSRAPLLPKVGFSETFTRGNDPVYVFGAKLRQQRFQTSDFDLNTLNRPAPLDNFTTSFAGRWTAFDSLFTQSQIRRASILEQSTTASAGRTDQEVIYGVIRTYESVLIADREVDVAQHAVDTAQALYKLSRNRVDFGVAVESDALSAQVDLSARQQDLIEARGNRGTAWAELEAAMGVTLPIGQTPLVPLAEHSFQVSPLPEEVEQAIKNRPDLKSLSLQTSAQQAAVRSAKSDFGPRVDGFGTWQADRQSFAGAGGANWVAGAEVRIDLLPFDKRARLQQEKAALIRAQAVHQSSESLVRVEVSRAYYEHQSAEQMVEVARTGRSQAEESRRILRNRYEAGLTTLTDVLRAEDAERQSGMSYWQAVYRNALSFAALRLATGTLNQDQVVTFQ
jgi:outer membrane protein